MLDSMLNFFDRKVGHEVGFWPMLDSMLNFFDRKVEHEDDHYPNNKKLRRNQIPAQLLFQIISGYQRAALAFSTREVKPAASVTAISERTLRSSSIPAFLRPFMNLE